MAAPDAVPATAPAAAPGPAAGRPPDGVPAAGAPADAAPASGAPASGSPADGLRSLWSPRSVAVVGASDNPAKWGHWLASGALAGRARREVHLVNRSGAEVCGVRTVRSVRELAGPVDLTAVVVPAPGVERAVIDALEAGTRAVLVITDGLRHRAPGRPRPAAELADRVTAAGARLVGPGSLGIVDTSEELFLAWGRFTAGPVAVVTQSGQVGSELAGLLARHGSGVSRFVSVGSQEDVGTEEVLAGLVTDEATRAVIVYVEGVRDPDGFLAAARDLRAAGKPLAVLAVGTSEAGSAAARSHTGALTGSMDVLDAACRSVGAVRARTPAEAAALAHALALGIRPRGNRIAVISDSGGQGALAADVAAAAGLTLAPLDGPARARARELLPGAAAPRNPVDLAGAGEQDLTRYAGLAEAVAGSADAVVLTGYFGRFGEDTPSLAEAELAVARRLSRVASRLPVAVHSMAEADNPVSRVLTDGGVGVFSDIGSTLGALAGCAAWTGTRPRALPVRRPAHPGPYDGPVGARKGRRPPRPGPYGAEGTGLGYAEAREVLRRAGIAVPPAETAHSPEEAAGISRRLPGRTVLKAAGLAHKTEAGGVVLGLDTAEQVAAAHRELVGRLGSDGVVVEQMDDRPGVVEVLVGVRHDPVFGPVILVGAGGVTAELWRDTAVELAPVTESEAGAMLARLRSFPLLRGWRGAPPVDLTALARAAASVSRIPLTEPWVTSCEINPLRAGPDGVLAVDALVSRAPSEVEETRP